MFIKPLSTQSREVRLTEKVGDVEARRARVADAVEISMALAELARVHDMALCENEELVEERDNVAPGLMDGEHDGPVKVTSERD
jgi:hypothetical protein